MVVGIVGDTREQGLRFAPTVTTYVPVAQSPEQITRLVVEKIQERIASDLERDGVVALRRNFDRLATRASFKETYPRGFAAFLRQGRNTTPTRAPIWRARP